MRKRVVFLGVVLAMTGSLVFADIDLSDFDDDVMRGMDDANKDLQPVMGAGNGEAAIADAEVLRDGFKWTEDYFVKKGGTDDAVKFARQSQELTASILKSLAAKDFDTATTTARTLANSCKTCHDSYKPLTK